MMKRMILLNLLLGLSILATGNAAAQTEALQEYSLPGMNVMICTQFSGHR